MNADTFRRCFRKEGILDDSFSVVTLPNEHDLFLDIDSNTFEIESLMAQVRRKYAHAQILSARLN